MAENDDLVKKLNEEERRLQERFEKDADAMKAAIDSARGSDSFPFAYDVPGVDADYIGKLEAIAVGEGYRTEMKDGKLHIDKP